MAVQVPSELTKWKMSSSLFYPLLLTLPVAAEWFLIYCKIGWQWTSNESWNTFRLRVCRTLIRPTWKNFFYSPARYVKSFMKTLRVQCQRTSPQIIICRIHDIVAETSRCSNCAIKKAGTGLLHSQSFKLQGIQYVYHRYVNAFSFQVVQKQTSAMFLRLQLMPRTSYTEFVERRRCQRGIFTMVLKWRLHHHWVG